jgi:hypothetical protein
MLNGETPPRVVCSAVFSETPSPWEGEYERHWNIRLDKFILGQNSCVSKLLSCQIAEIRRERSI